MLTDERMAFIAVFTGLLEDIWMDQHQLRFGQLLENLFGCVKEKECIFYREDHEVRKALEDILEADVVSFE